MGKVSIEEIAEILKENGVEINEEIKEATIVVLEYLEKYLRTTNADVEKEIQRMEELLGRKLTEEEIAHIKKKLEIPENTISIPPQYKKSFSFARNNILFVKRLISLL